MGRQADRSALGVASGFCGQRSQALGVTGRGVGQPRRRYWYYLVDGPTGSFSSGSSGPDAASGLPVSARADKTLAAPKLTTAKKNGAREPSLTSGCLTNALVERPNRISTHEPEKTGQVIHRAAELLLLAVLRGGCGAASSLVAAPQPSSEKAVGRPCPPTNLMPDRNRSDGTSCFRGSRRPKGRRHASSWSDGRPPAGALVRRNKTCDAAAFIGGGITRQWPVPPRVLRDAF